MNTDSVLGKRIYELLEKNLEATEATRRETEATRRETEATRRETEATRREFEQKWKESNAIAEAMALEQKFIKDKLPDHVSYVKLKASDGCESSTHGKVKEYLSLLESLNMAEPKVPENYKQGPSPKIKRFIYKWGNNETEQEGKAYDALVNHLQSNGIHAYNISNGQSLNRSLLFNERLWTLRSRDSAGFSQSVVTIGEVSGRTDVVVLREALDSPHILRNMVHFAIEIKRPEFLKATTADFNGSIREATLQLIGLCAHNNNYTPAVLLTDLRNGFFVLYLTKVNGAKLIYKVEMEKFYTLEQAVEFASTVSSRECISLNFGRQPSPNESLRDSASDDSSPLGDLDRLTK